MVLVMLRSSLFAEEAQHQLSFLTLQMWEQMTNIHALLTVLQDSQERTLDKLHAVSLLGVNSRSESNVGGIIVDPTVSRRGPAAVFHPSSSAVRAEV